MVAAGCLAASQHARSEGLDWSQLQTTLGSDPNQATLNAVGGGETLNSFLGATRYYNNSIPITGLGTITYNLEAGHIWGGLNGHETLKHVTSYFNTTGAWGGGAVDPLIDRHATAVGMLIGGRQTSSPEPYQTGIAPNTDLRSAAAASLWIGTRYTLNWAVSEGPFFGAMNHAFNVAKADVINSSIGIGYDDPYGAGGTTIKADGFAWQNPHTTYVTIAGNGGSNPNTVVPPGSGYNSITVGALTKGTGPSAPYDTVADFSGRGPQGTSYTLNYGTVTVNVPDVRAVVDITAPGDQIISAYYGGTTGGNNNTLTGLPNGDVGTTSSYSPTPLSGTSYAAPLVAGGASLIVSAAKTLPGMSLNPDASQSVVVKALLLSGADKTAGWTNNLNTVTVDSHTFQQTTQSLDWAAGAGRMNLDRTFELQTTGTMDVPLTETGRIGTGLLKEVDPIGWDYGKAVVGAGNNDYVFSTSFNGMTEFNTTLTWQRYRKVTVDVNGTPTLWSDLAQADLNVSFWKLSWSAKDNDWVFSDKIAESSSLYNVVEHLSFQVPTSGRYGLRVSYPSNLFDGTYSPATQAPFWGKEANPQPYGLAWSLTAVPEPSVMIPHAALLAAGLSLRSRRSRKELLRP